jgi:hypothetical protein
MHAPAAERRAEPRCRGQGAEPVEDRQGADLRIVITVGERNGLLVRHAHPVPFLCRPLPIPSCLASVGPGQVVGQGQDYACASGPRHRLRGQPPQSGIVHLAEAWPDEVEQLAVIMHRRQLRGTRDDRGGPREFDRVHGLLPRGAQGYRRFGIAAAHLDAPEQHEGRPDLRLGRALDVEQAMDGFLRIAPTSAPEVDVRVSSEHPRQQCEVPDRLVVGAKPIVRLLGTIQVEGHERGFHQVEQATGGVLV